MNINGFMAMKSRKYCATKALLNRYAHGYNTNSGVGLTNLPVFHSACEIFSCRRAFFKKSLF